MSAVHARALPQTGVYNFGTVRDAHAGTWSIGEGQCWATWPGYEAKCWATAGVHRRQP